MRHAHAGPRLLRLQVGGQSFALDLAVVAGIEAGDALAEASWSGDLIGSIIHAGQEVNVHLLAPRLGLPMFTAGTKTRGAVVVVRTRRRIWGMLCDRVLTETNATVEVQPAPGACGRAGTLPFSGVALYRNGDAVELAWIIDPDRLHPDDPPRERAPAAPVERRASTFLNPPRPGGTERRGQLLMFPLGNLAEKPIAAGLSYRQVLEVLPMPALTPAPFAPPHVQGVCEWRGRALAVVDFGQRLGMPSGAEGRRKLVVARATPEGELLGLAAPLQVSPLRLPAPHGAGEDPGGPVLGAFELADRTLLVPDLGALAASL